MSAVPSEIGGARVVCYAPIDARSRPTGYCKHYHGSTLLGPAAGLAICQYKGESYYYLFGCDETWRSVTDSWHETLDDAKRQAELEYEGVTRAWVHRSES